MRVVYVYSIYHVKNMSTIIKYILYFIIVCHQRETRVRYSTFIFHYAYSVCSFVRKTPRLNKYFLQSLNIGIIQNDCILRAVQGTVFVFFLSE